MTFSSTLVGIILLVVALLLLFFALSWLASVLGGAQFVQTPTTVFPTIVELARLSPGEQFLELGAGRGDLCRYIAKETGAKATGVDINPLLVLYGRWVTRRNPDVTLRLENVYAAPLRRANVVYCYLLPHMLAKLAPRFRAELMPGTRVVSYAFPLPERTPSQTIPRTPSSARVFLYEY